MPVCDTEVLKRFQMIIMKLYDGTTDYKEYIGQYMEIVEIILILMHLK